MKASFHHRQLVVAGCNIVSDFYVMAKELGGFRILFVLRSQIGQLKQSIRKVRVRLECLLKQFISFSRVTLTLFNEAEIVETRRIVRICLQSFAEILSSFVESSQVPIRETHERKRACGWIECDQSFKLLNRFLCFA